MKVENKENNRKIQQVAATMAIEDMYMSKDCLQGLIDVANGTKQGVTEELKATDMMRWIGLMNNIRACADEIVLNDIVCLTDTNRRRTLLSNRWQFFLSANIQITLSCEVHKYNRSGRKVISYIGCNFFMNSIDKKTWYVYNQNMQRKWRCFYEKGRNLKCKQKRTSQ